MNRCVCQSSRHTPISATMSERTYQHLSAFVQETLGIKMPVSKKTMLQARLLKRLRSLGMHTFEEYCDYVFSAEGRKLELANLIDVVTTNKTDFFREPKHFDYLQQTAIPALAEIYDFSPNNPLQLWSAGCSSGEEPYSLAMVLAELSRQWRGFYYSILATDISTKMLDMATMGIYKEEQVEPVPSELKKKYLLRSRDWSRQEVRVVAELRAKVRFRRLNFMAEDFGMRHAMDIIFCRNVIIYFAKATQERLLNRFCRYLVPGGYLFLGHSETINGMRVPLHQVAPTVYRKPRK